MGLSIGDDRSRYVVVRNLTVRLNFSLKVVFADLIVSRKTGKPKVNEETGEVLVDDNGIPIPERIYQRFKAKFVGNAAEEAKKLSDGTAIDILNGWLEKEEYTAQNGKHRSEIFCIISEFELSAPRE